MLGHLLGLCSTFIVIFVEFMLGHMLGLYSNITVILHSMAGFMLD